MTIKKQTPQNIMNCTISIYSQEVPYFKNKNIGELIKSKNRKNELVELRYLLYYLLRYYSTVKLSYNKIGEYIGSDQDHSTIIYGIGEIDKYLKSDKSLIKKFNYILNLLNDEYSIPKIALVIFEKEKQGLEFEIKNLTSLRNIIQHVN